MVTYIEYRLPDVVHQGDRQATRQFVCQQKVSVDHASRKKQ